MLKKRQMIKLLKSALMHFYGIDLDKDYGYHVVSSQFRYTYSGHYEWLRIGRYQLCVYPSGKLYLDVTFWNDDLDAGYETKRLGFYASDILPAEKAV